VSLVAEVGLRIGSLVLDIAIETGPGTLVVAGPNGAGKSSFLAALLGILPLQKGRIVVGTTVLADVAAGIDSPVEDRRLGFVPQDYALFPHLNVRRNIEFALESAGVIRDASYVDSCLHDLGLQALSDRYPRHLSGGEKQRVALARALSVNPQALLLDEPLAALDVSARQEVRLFLSGYLRKLRLPAVLVTHDATDARELGDRIAVLESGRITQTGSWSELVAQPATPFIAAFVDQGTFERKNT
jgi:molybdate transport system ATP-binding protein